MTPQPTTVFSLQRFAIRMIALGLVLICAVALYAQNPATAPRTATPPVTDSAAQASPTTPPPAAPVTDDAAQASPAGPAPHGPATLTNTDLSVRVHQAADSAHSRNGDMLRATLASPVRVPGGKSFPAGTRVGLTVVSVAAAGKLQSRGEMSIQVVSIGGVPTFSEVITLHGTRGHKDLPDSAPEKGTEAVLATNTTLHFKIPSTPKQ